MDRILDLMQRLNERLLRRRSEIDAPMRFVPYRHRIPRSFARHPKAKGLVAEADIAPHPHGRICAKLLVFNSPASLRRFWRDGLARPDLGRHCRGVVNSLLVQIDNVRDGRDPIPVRLRGDPRYFCVIGLCLGHLTMEVVAHEAVHAGFSYAKRVRRDVFRRAMDNDEELVAYPAGAVAAAINRYIHDKGLYDRKPTRTAKRKRK